MCIIIDGASVNSRLNFAIQDFGLMNRPQIETNYEVIKHRNREK